MFENTSLFLVFLLSLLFIKSSQSYLYVAPKEIVVKMATPSFADNRERVDFICKNLTGIESPPFNPVLKDPVSCQIYWAKDGTPLPHSSKHRYEETNGHLYITNISLTDSGVYQCMCVNCDTGTVHKAEGILKIEPSAVWTIGYSESINCIVTKDTNLIRWYKRGLPRGGLIGEKRIGKKGSRIPTNYIVHDNGTLTIKEVEVSSDGVYRCVTSNRTDKNSTNFYIVVQWPSSVSQSVTKCKNWIGEEEKGTLRNTKYKEMKKVLSSTNYLDAEYYWSKEERKRREHPPVVIKAPPTCIVERIKRRLEIPCHAVGYPIPTITWTKNDDIFISQLTQYDIWSNSRKLTFIRLTRYETGTYTCRIHSKLGNYSFNVKLEVDDIKQSCGRVYTSSSGRVKRVSGGEKVNSITEWPWQVYISFVTQPGSFCGGTIVDRNKILTAYHCTVYSVLTHQFIEPKDMIVTVGVYNRTLASEATRQVLNIKFIYRILAGDKTSLDIAMIEVYGEIVFSEHIRPICLPTRSESVPSEGTECIVSGYGLTSASGTPSDVLQKASVSIISWNECKNEFNFISEGTLCTGSNQGKGTCPGDSGGPLACWRNTTDQWVQMGVVFGGDCPAGINMFSNVVLNRFWIRNAFKSL